MNRDDYKMMTDERKPTVILFKSSAEDDSKADHYVTTLACDGFDAHCVPVLSFRFTSVESLQTALSRDSSLYSCLVLTSPRAVAAIQQSFTQQGLTALIMARQCRYSLEEQTNICYWSCY